MSTLGKLLALADYEEQAEMLNEMGKTLRRVCENQMYAEIQLCRVVDRLDTDGKKLIQSLASFIASDGAR